MAGEDRQPDIDRIQSAEPLDHETGPQWNRHLRDDGNVQRAPGISRSLHTTGIEERIGDQQARHAQDPKQLHADVDHTGAGHAEDPQQLARKEEKNVPTNAAAPNPYLAAMWTARSARSGRPAPRFWPAMAAAAPIKPTDVQVTSENSWV